MFLMNLELFRQIFEKPQITNFIKILPVGAELFHADPQKDRLTDTHDKINRHFSILRKRLFMLKRFYCLQFTKLCANTVYVPNPTS
jgi:hypothetical protein